MTPSTQAPTATDAPNTAPPDDHPAAEGGGGRPRSAAARRAAGEPVSEPQHDSPELLDVSREATPLMPTAGMASEVAAVTDDGPVSQEELRAFRQFRAARSAEIAEAIANAPVAIGTDLNPFTLVHLRGCPQPTRTETYQVKDPRGRDFTVHRCQECGAHLAVPHHS